MELMKINAKDLIFSDSLGDIRTNTYLNLADYDWMNYTLTTQFKTEKMGVLDVVFEYYGCYTSEMKVTQTLNTETKTIVYEYSSDLFKTRIIDFMTKHIKSWDEEFAFNGEDEVIDFYNAVLEQGTIKKVL